MSLGNDRNSNNKIVSKYFTTESGMDESLSDFQEKKISYNRSKKKKPSNTVKKVKKLKGQRDIRTLVKPRKNELLTYTKDFDQACRSSGLDVDSEQLQIAIALSKSLQEVQPQPIEVCSDVKPLTAKERSQKIKSTLQEYGFKVPNTTVQVKKRRVTNKYSKLLNTSEYDRKKLISSKYLQILESNSTLPEGGLIESDQSDKELYHKTTNVPYSKIKSVDEFYVPNLIEKTTQKSSLLKDWSKIPGRPLSPVVQVNEFKFDEVSFCQQELDCLLSHPLQEAHEIIKNKSMSTFEENVAHSETKVDINVNSETKLGDLEICSKDNKCDVNYINSTQRDRSQSPDLFDEDDYLITEHVKFEIQCPEIKSASSDKTLFMDLTECVSNYNNFNKTITYSTKPVILENSKLLDLNNTAPIVSNGSIKNAEIIQNVTKLMNQNKQSNTYCSETVRDMNDLMEVTNCVVSKYNHDITSSRNEVKSKSVGLKQAHNEGVHVTKDRSSNINENMTIALDFIKENNSTAVKTVNSENIDLTQASYNTLHSETNDNNPLTLEVDNNVIKAPVSIDLTQSSNSNEDFTIANPSSEKEQSSEDTIILFDQTHNNFLKENILIPHSGNSIDNISLICEKDVIIKSQNNFTTLSAKKGFNIVNKENNNVCSDSIELEVNEKSDLPVNTVKAQISMDLTQSSNSEEDFPIVKISNNKEDLSEVTIILYDHDTSNHFSKENILIPYNSNSLDNISLTGEKHSNNKSQSSITTIRANKGNHIVNKKSDNVYGDSIVLDVNEKTDLPLVNIGQVETSKCDKLSQIDHDSKMSSENDVDHAQSPGLESMREDRIDLTQSPQSLNKTHSIESLGKQNNISIDYDELYNNVIAVSPESIHDQQNVATVDISSITESIDHDNDQSEVINYNKTFNETKESQIKSKVCSFIEPLKKINVNSDIEAVSCSSRHVENNCVHSTYRNSNLLSVEVKEIDKIKDMVMVTKHKKLSPNKIPHVSSLGTPRNDQYIIKTQNVTRMMDYESMSTPMRNKELGKHGIKPFKRKRAIQLLTYIYNQTHPVVEDCGIGNLASTSKKFKPNNQDEEIEKIPHKQEHKIANKENNLYMETKVNPDIRKIECCPDDWVFQTREKAKVHSCRVPLHVAFHNYVSCRHMLRTAILRYEPVNIDIIHKDLVASGYRYNPKDLLKFLDKKCITVKTTENNARNRKFNKT